MFDHFQKDIKAAQGRHYNNLLQLVFSVAEIIAVPVFQVQ